MYKKKVDTARKRCEVAVNAKMTLENDLRHSWGKLERMVRHAFTKV
jgi:hypothetical protein